tara:strand:+ start:7158 stop:7502 length:345 start_codon:yes stop_codon:yes gene_type:complete
MQVKDLSPEKFEELLSTKTNALIVKFGATWCGPCKKIAPYLHGKLATKKNVGFLDIDVDENYDLYSAMKRKKIVTKLPTILHYSTDNTDFYPTFSVVGVNPKMVDEMFNQIEDP